MKELDMIKAFAELEGVTATIKSHFNYENGNIESLFIDHKDKSVLPSIIRGGKGYPEYNPITDHALTFKAMVDYDVQKSQSMINPEKTIISIRGSEHVVSVFIRKEIPHAIIECILKSKGLWVG